MYEPKIGDVCEVVGYELHSHYFEIGSIVEMIITSTSHSEFTNVAKLLHGNYIGMRTWHGDNAAWIPSIGLSYICHIDDWPTHPRNPANLKPERPPFRGGRMRIRTLPIESATDPETQDEIFERAFDQMYKNQTGETTMEKITIATRVEIEQEDKTLPPIFKYENIEEAPLANIIAKHGGDRKAALKRHRAEYAERNKVAIKDLENVRLFTSGPMQDVTERV